MKFADKFLQNKFTGNLEPPKKLLDSLPPPGLSNKDQAEGLKRSRSNTTIIALKYQDGVLLSADRRTSNGNYGIMADDTRKICQLTDHSAIGSAGYCNVISHLERTMVATCSTFRALYGNELSPDGQANYLKNALEPWWFFFVTSWLYSPGLPILVAYDMKKEKPRIFLFEDTGFYMEIETFTGIGCGYEVINGLLADHYRSNLTEREAINLAVRAMLHSGRLSHGVSDSRLVPPVVATINKKNGFLWQEGPVRTEIRKIRKQVEVLK